MNEQSTPTVPLAPSRGTPGSLWAFAFGIFATFSLPLILAALAGHRLDPGAWLMPLVFPVSLAFYSLMIKAPEGEAARQAADVSRWQV